MIGLASVASPDNFYWAHTSNPRNGLTQQITSSGWSSFNIPLADFSMPAGTLIGRISVRINEPVPIRTAYLDRIQFASYQSGTNTDFLLYTSRVVMVIISEVVFFSVGLRAYFYRQQCHSE
jgi:hypothetical protein